MKSYRSVLEFDLPQRRQFVNITPQVEQALKESGVREGLCLVNAMNITASVFINDDESGLHADFEKWLDGVPIRSVIVDPAAASFIAELGKRGYRVLKADNDVEDGIREVASMLNMGLLVFCDTCINTIMEFGSYIWDEKALERGEDKPIKQHDHAMDATRYLCSTIIGNKLAKLKDVRM